MRDGSGLSYLPDKLLDLEYSLINKTNLIRIHEWDEAKVNMWRYENLTDSAGATYGVRWWKQEFARATAVKSFYIRSEGIAARDYQNDTKIPDIWTGTTFDFDRDPEEHFTRLNSIGNLHERFMKLSWMNIEFEKELVVYSEQVG